MDDAGQNYQETKDVVVIMAKECPHPVQYHVPGNLQASEQAISPQILCQASNLQDNVLCQSTDII